MQTMNENDFWSAIEAAWHSVDPRDEQRQAILARRPAVFSSPHVQMVVRAMLQNLETYLDTLDADTLLAFDHIMEQNFSALTEQTFTNIPMDQMMASSIFVDLS